MRHYDDWIDAYQDFADVTETPRYMHFWAGISAVSAVLGRKVWLDMQRFRWYPNLYLVFVGPPEEVRKSTTVGSAKRLLKTVEGFDFAPKTTTWEGLIKTFDMKQKPVQIGETEDDFEIQSVLYVQASEFGTFFDARNPSLGMQLIDLFDGEELDKSTKGNGSEYVERPLLSFTACTTPQWLRDNLSSGMIGDGLFSRIIFICFKEPEREIAWVDTSTGEGDESMAVRLSEDLQEISQIRGPVLLSPEARTYGEEWYHDLKIRSRSGEAEVLQRRQTQVVKLSISLAASKNSIQGKNLLITKPIFRRAVEILDETNVQRKEIISILRRDKASTMLFSVIEGVAIGQMVKLQEHYQRNLDSFPKWKDYLEMMRSAKEAGLIDSIDRHDGQWFKRVK